MSFGPHLMMDLTGCPTEVLQDLQLHFNYLNNTPDLIGMTRITQPHVFPYSGLVPEDKGITGHVIIAESHLTIHSFEEKGYVFLDVFSCKEFDIEKTIDIIVKTFKPASYTHWVIQRGTNFPRS